MQRKGYSLKRGETLRNNEDKARKIWWSCENSSLATFNEKYGSAKKKAKKKKVKKTKVSKPKITKPKLFKVSNYSTNNNPKYTTTNKQNITSAGTTFTQHSAIVIKSKFQGDKQIAWLEYYQKPSKCHHPKTLGVFAYCNEDKLQQQNQFSKEYQLKKGKRGL